MKKSWLRKEFKSGRNNLTLIERQSFDLMILQQLKSYPCSPFNYLLSYFPIEKHNEPNTFLFSGYFKNELPDLHICKPRINADGSMDAIETTENTAYQKNHYDIHEPDEAGTIISPDKIDVIFVPLLAFDTKGYRVGYGKGFYDKYLPLCNPDIVKIGFSYFPPVHNIEDTNEYDIPLTLCFTPSEVYEF